MGIKNKKKMLVILLTIFCLGCGENGYNGDIETEHSVSTGNDIYVQETEEDASADMDGWENKGEEQRYVWGSWTVTGVWRGSEWSEDSDWVGDTYELLPDSCTYKNKNGTDSAKLKGNYVTVAGENGLAPFNQSSYELPGNYCLEIELSKADPSTFFGIIFGSLFLVARDEMIAISGRSMFRLEKTEDYDGETEGNGFVVSDHGIWYGDWEITEVLKADQDDAERWIGQRVDMTEHENYHRVLMKSLSNSNFP